LRADDARQDQVHAVAGGRGETSQNHEPAKGRIQSAGGWQLFQADRS
jgi:hypothetical protein